MSDFRIGTVLYLLSPKDQKILPVILDEQLVRFTTKGESRSWKVKCGPENIRATQKSTVIDSIKGDLFLTLGEAKQALVSMMLQNINDMCHEAADKAAVWYGVSDSSWQEDGPELSDTGHEEIFDQAVQAAEQDYQATKMAQSQGQQVQSPPVPSQPYNNVKTVNVSDKARELADPELFQREIVQ